MVHMIGAHMVLILQACGSQITVGASTSIGPAPGRPQMVFARTG